MSIHAGKAPDDLETTRNAITAASGNVATMAEMLGLTVSSAYRRIQRHELSSLVPPTAVKRGGRPRNMEETMVRVPPSPDERRVLEAVASGRVISWRGTPMQAKLRKYRWITTWRCHVGIVIKLTNRGRLALATHTESER